MASERVKSLSYSELKIKKAALIQYLRDVEEEIELRDQKSGDNTFPLSKQAVTEKPVKKSSPKKKTPVKKNNNEEIKNEITIKATMKIMKEVLDKEEINYKSNVTRDQLIQIVRENYLVRKCNSESEKAKAKKK